MKLGENKKVLSVLKIMFFFTPFILGTIGYLLAGVNILQALYSAMCLYLLNCAAVEWNYILEIARWLAAIASASGILMLMKRAYENIKGFLMCLSGKAVVIYCDDSKKQILEKNIKRSVFSSQDNVYSGVKDNIIMLSNDLENLNFYYKNEKKFANSNVYVRMEQIDSFLLKNSKINFFNETELVAKNYWKEYNLLRFLQGDRLKVKIAIIGFEQLGQKILSYGLMNNIYAQNQSIEYHVWGQSMSYEQLFSKIDLMNGDSVTYHGEDWTKNLNELADFDRVIVTQEDNLELLQSLLYVCRETEIDYYNKGEAEMEKVFASEQLRSFGMQEQIFTEKNIMGEELYRLGMELNYSYEHGYMEEADELIQKEALMRSYWDRLDGFTKASNIAAADYHEMRLMILKALDKSTESFTEKEKNWLSEAEHIRWCRFHFLNHWIYKPLEGKRKDKSKRIHTYLIPFDQLKQDVKDMDWDTIMRLMHFKNEKG